MKKIIILLFITMTLFSCSDDSNTKTKIVLPEDVWVLEWNSRHGNYSCDLKREYMLFFSEEDAKIKAKELEDAWAIVKNTSVVDTKIKIFKQKK